jgi:hypothetical protein
MNILIIGGIAALGYELNKKPRATSDNNKYKFNEYRNEGSHEPYPVKSSHQIEENKKQMQEMMNKHYNDPKTIGAHNMKPFFKSEKTQNTNDNFKDRRLSMFTGNNNYDYKPKVETYTMFKPQREEHVSSSKAQPNDKDRYTASNIQTNVLPFEQVKVGRGVGVDPSVSATGGFHSHFRIKPDNVNGYKKNQFENRINVGRALQDNVSKDNVGAIQEFDKTIYQCQRPTMPIKTMVDARASRGTEVQKCTGRGSLQKDGFGASYLPGAQQTINNDITRTKDSTKHGFIGNPSREGYDATRSNTNYIINDNERGDCISGSVFTNVHGQGAGVSNRYTDNARNTLRQTTQCNSYSGPAQGQFPTNGSNTGFVNNTPKDVKRQCLTHNNTEGIISTNVRGDTTRMYGANQTKRENINSSEMNKGNCIQGLKSVPYSIDANNYRASVGHDMNRESTSYSHTPNMSRVNNLSDPLQTTGNVFVKNDTSSSSIIYTSKQPSINNYKQTNNMGSVMLEQDRRGNERLDFGIFNTQHKQNPYNRDVTKKPTDIYSTP